MTARQAFILTLVVLGTVLAAYLVYWLAAIIILLFGAIVFASAIRPFVAAMAARGLHQGRAILLIYTAIIISVVVLLVLSVPPLLAFMVQIFASGVLTEQVTQIANRLALFGWDRYQVLLPVIRLPAQLDALLAQTGTEVQRQAWTITQSTLVGLGQVLLLFTMTYFWLTSREQALALLLLLSPKEHRQQVNAIWTDVELRLGAYVRGQAILMFVIGFAAFVGLVLLRVPYAGALALIAGLTEAIPFVGPVAGAVPAIIVAFTVSPLTGLLIAAYYMLIQVLENNVLVPRIMAANVGLNPLVIIIALVAGGTLNGIVGALLAIPVAGAIQVIVQHLWVTPALAQLPPKEPHMPPYKIPGAPPTEEEVAETAEEPPPLPTPEELLEGEEDETEAEPGSDSRTYAAEERS